MAMTEADENVDNQHSLTRLEERMQKALAVFNLIEEKSCELEGLTVNLKEGAEDEKVAAVSGYTTQRLHIYMTRIEDIGQRIKGILNRTHNRLESKKLNE